MQRDAQQWRTMGTMSRKNNILASLRKLKEKDVYSLLLYLLYRLKDDEKYSTVSMLTWALDHDSLLNFLTLFSGVDMKVPSIDDLKVVVLALQLYQMVALDGGDLEESLADICTGEVPAEAVRDAYFRISELASSGELPDALQHP